MKLSDLIGAVGDEPVFETGLLLAGDIDEGDVRRQLSRWVAAGKLVQLRRGLYALAAPYAKSRPHPFVIANRLERGSYVSLQSALAYHGAIPEYVPLTTSVTGGAPSARQTPLGEYSFRHVSKALFWGAARVEVAPGQHALVASAEKALVDLAHLTPGSDTRAFVGELRLEPTAIDTAELLSLSERTGKPRLRRMAIAVAEVLSDAEKGWVTL
jgi:predicted transcriptional regulator of viral defense system